MSPKTAPGKTRGEIFNFVQKRILAGVPPTVREVQQAFGFRSPQTAREHLELLVTEGRLIKKPGISRGYRLPDTPAHTLIPLLGQVQAGLPTAAIETIETYLPVSADIHGDLFALRVNGESMKDAGILHDDIVIVRQQADANDGDIVVALIDDDATVKRLRRQQDRVVLYPENPAFDPIIPDQLILLGKVVEVRRILTGNRHIKRG